MFQPFLEKNVVRMGCSARDNSFFDDELLHKYNDIYHICNMYSILLYVYVYMYIYISILYSALLYIITLDTIAGSRVLCSVIVCNSPKHN